MAAPGETETDVTAHKRGYEGFIGMMKWGAVISLILALIVILVIRK